MFFKETLSNEHIFFSVKFIGNDKSSILIVKQNFIQILCDTSVVPISKILLMPYSFLLIWHPPSSHATSAFTRLSREAEVWKVTKVCSPTDTRNGDFEMLWGHESLNQLLGVIKCRVNNEILSRNFFIYWKKRKVLYTNKQKPDQRIQLTTKSKLFQCWRHKEMVETAVN